MGLISGEQKPETPAVTAAKERITKILLEQEWLKTKPKSHRRRGSRRYFHNSNPDKNTHQAPAMTKTSANTVTSPNESGK